MDWSGGRPVVSTIVFFGSGIFGDGLFAANYGDVVPFLIRLQASFYRPVRVVLYPFFVYGVVVCGVHLCFFVDHSVHVASGRFFDVTF